MPETHGVPLGGPNPELDKFRRAAGIKEGTAPIHEALVAIGSHIDNAAERIAAAVVWATVYARLIREDGLLDPETADFAARQAVHRWQNPQA